MADFTYMGSKKLLAPRIAELAAGMADGPFLDLFSGIAAVGSQIGTQRPVWCNDVQHFSKLLTSQKFCARRSFRKAAKLVADARPHFSANQSALGSNFSEALKAEAEALSSASADLLREIISTVQTVGRARRAELCMYGWHCMLATTHGGTYFGLRQAADLDSIRYAADKLLANGMIDDDEHRWMVLALCQVVSTINNSTGHFAQYLSPSYMNIHRIVRKRNMDVWSLWVRSLSEIRPLGTVAWRRGNRVFATDAVGLLRGLSGKVRQPAVIYADPPYTSDQYSRYYHVLENVVLYDYPETVGKGQYRPGRFTSRFSLKSAVGSAFEELIASAADLRGVFMLSYPTNGLLQESTQRVLEILSRHFAHVEDPVVMPHMHSTMGGSKGPQKHAVEENIFIAYQDPAARHREKKLSAEAPPKREYPSMPLSLGYGARRSTAA